MPQLYQEILSSQLSPKVFHFLHLVIGGLGNIRQVKLESLAHAVGVPIYAESRRKRLQRFLDLDCWDLDVLWIPMVLAWMKQHFRSGQMIYVILDRTNWKGINLIMVSIGWGKRAFPMYWQLLDKKGSTNLMEQQQVLAPVLEALKGYKLVVLGDREFCSVRLASWLDQCGVQFCLRLKRNESVEISEDHWETTLSLALQPGTSRFYNDVKVTKQKGFGQHNLAIKWKRDYGDFRHEEPWLILTNLEDLDTALKAYAKRFQIEEMFRDFKKGGYCLESAKVQGKRFINLVLFIAIAYTSSVLKARRCHAQGIKPYLIRPVQSKGHRHPRHSHFYSGSFAAIWANTSVQLQEHLEALMRLNPNKRLFYAQGLYAMSLVQQGF
jgi:Transposase DDE domain